jgi:predicted nucleic acid-binding protein
MKLYLDNCSLQRPLDERSQVRIALEAEAVLAILSLCESEEVRLVSSHALLYEIRRSPIMARQEYALQVLSQAAELIELTDEVERRAGDFVAAGVKPLDALHLASAEAAGVDFFCTCDDRLLRKAQTLPNLAVEVRSPLDLASELTNGS